MRRMHGNAGFAHSGLVVAFASSTGTAMACPQLGALGDRPGHRVLVTSATGLRIVHRPKSILYFFYFFECQLSRVELALRHKAVSLVIKVGGRFLGGSGQCCHRYEEELQ